MGFFDLFKSPSLSEKILKNIRGDLEITRDNTQDTNDYLAALFQGDVEKQGEDFGVVDGHRGPTSEFIYEFMMLQYFLHELVISSVFGDDINESLLIV